MATEFPLQASTIKFVGSEVESWPPLPRVEPTRLCPYYLCEWSRTDEATDTSESIEAALKAHLDECHSGWTLHEVRDQVDRFAKADPPGKWGRVLVPKPVVSRWPLAPGWPDIANR